ncbi:MAG: tripartite tricarboxylate transporter TctB family protein [Pseudomonadota bacterium]
MHKSTAPWEIGVSLFFIAACLVAIWETRDIPPGTFEPLGSAPVPQAVAALIIVLSIAVIVTALRGKTAVDLPLGYQPRPLDALIVAVFALGYVFAMQERVLAFAPLTAIFLVATIGFLNRFKPRTLPMTALVAVVIGWGCQYVFTRVFIVDLPGL